MKPMKTQLIAFMLLLLMACHSPILIEQYQELPNETWHKGQSIEFSTLIPDSGFYHVSLHIRHTIDYKATNLWCILSSHPQNDTIVKDIIITDTINIPIATLTGQWLGQGGNLKNITYPILKNPVTLPKGQFTFRITPGINNENLKGIKSVGIKIEQVTELEK